jgi:hypothetical protein
MNKTVMFALATSVVVGLGSAAMAGEGSPDLALPSYGPHASDPDGSNYPSSGAFGDTSSAWQGRYSTAPRLRDRDANTGRVIRQNNYEDQTGINGE